MGDLKKIPKLKCNNTLVIKILFTVVFLRTYQNIIVGVLLLESFFASNNRFEGFSP